MIARPTLLIRETLDNGDDEDADESDENISPDADKSSLRFTLERRRDQGNDDNDNNDGPGRDRGFRGDNPQSRQNGRQGDGQGGGPRFFHEKADGGDNKGGDGDSNRFNNGPGGGINNNNNNDNNDDNDNNNNNGDDGKGGGGKDNGNRGGNNGNGNGDDNNGDGRDGNKDGNGRDNGGGNGSNSNSDDNNSSTPPPPPPPPPPSSSTTSTTSAVEATTTTSDVIPTPSVVFTTSVITSITAPETTVSSISQEIIIPTLTPLADLDPSAVQSAISSSSIPGVSLSTSISDSSPPVPTPTEGANNRDNGNNSHGRNGNKSNGNNNRGPGGGLTSTSEQVLVAIGSVGVFIVLCFILWIVVRTLKKSKRAGRRYDDSSWSARLIPWRKQPKPSNAQGFNSFYEKESLPAYDAGGKNSMEGYGYYDQTKLYPLEPENVSYPPPAAARLQNGMAMRQIAESQQRQLLPNSVGQYPPQLNVQIGDSYNNDVNSTLRSRMPDAYYTQSVLSRQPSNAYNPTQRQVYRASEISSLSSGFGDGDIIMPPPNVIMVPKTSTPAAAVVAAGAPTNAEGNGNNRPFSWMSRAGTEQKRDTVYTTASDRRTRFHSVNSWVDQQKRRLMKAS
ncbi:hypothetical protein GGR55DRAFT_683113 [Xylaria sp. FL0064]|nr:hypothetical protein GGR55DRAFT_683113 [Xylaria sp. FL0064]